MSNNKQISILSFCTIFVGIIVGNNINKFAGYIVCILSAIIAVIFILKDSKDKK